MNHKEGKRKPESLKEKILKVHRFPYPTFAQEVNAVFAAYEAESRIPSVVTAEITEFWKQWVQSLPICDTTSTPRFPIPAGKCHCGTYPENLGPCLEYSPDGKDGRCPYCAHGRDCHHWAYIVFAQAWANVTRMVSVNEPRFDCRRCGASVAESHVLYHVCPPNSQLSAETSAQDACEQCKSNMRTYAKEIEKLRQFCASGHDINILRSTQPASGATRICKANRTADPPQDCDWPFCGCDPVADKVIEEIQESGHQLVKTIPGLAQSAIDEHAYARLKKAYGKLFNENAQLTGQIEELKAKAGPASEAGAQELGICDTVSDVEHKKDSGNNPCINWRASHPAQEDADGE